MENNKDAFLAWLSQNVAASRLSDFYLAYAEIEEFARDKRIISGSLYDVFDTTIVSRINLTLSLDRKFRFQHRGQMNVIISAGQLYLKYVKQESRRKRLLEAKGIEPDTKPAETSAAPEDPVIVFLKKEELEYIDLREKDGCLWVVGGEDKQQVLQPIIDAGVKLSYKGNGGQATRWRAAWWTRSDTKNIQIKSRHVEDNVQTNTKPQPNIGPQPNKEPQPATHEDKTAPFGSLEEFHNKIFAEITMNSRRRNEFNLWMLKQGYSRSASNGYASAVDNGLSDISDEKQKLIAPDQLVHSFFMISSRRELLQTWNELVNANAFEVYSQSQFRTLSAAIKKYAEFLEQNEQVSMSDHSETKTERSAVGTTSSRSAAKLHPGQIEFEKWLTDTGCPEGSAKTYANSISRMGAFLTEQGLEARNIFAIHSVSRLERIKEKLKQDGRLELGTSDTYALMKYTNFRRGPLSSEKNETDAQFAEILKENFPDGYRLHSIIDRNRFKQRYEERYGLGFNIDDDEMITRLKRSGDEVDGRVFYRDNVNGEDLIDDILEDIAVTFKSGASCIYFSEIFDRYRNRLSGQLKIYTQDAMKDQLMSSSYGEYLSNQHYLYLMNRAVDVGKDIMQVISRSQAPMNYEEIHRELWYIPLDEIKKCLVRNAELVNVARETYFYARNLPVSAEELRKIAELIHGRLSQSSFITDAELREIISDGCPAVAINTESFTTWGLRNCLEVLFQGQFSFNGPIISEKGRELDTYQVYKEFSHSHEHLTREELEDFAKAVNGGIIYWAAVLEGAVRISEDELVSKSRITFDIDATDAVIEEMFEGRYMSLQDFTFFLHFPPIGVKWNVFVLESYVYSYSKKFTLMHASFSAQDCCGAIVRTDSGIDDFSELVSDVLVNSDKWKTKEDALALLVGKGYLKKKRYTKIDEILPKAQAQREKMHQKAEG